MPATKPLTISKLTKGYKKQARAVGGLNIDLDKEGEGQP